MIEMKTCVMFMSWLIAASVSAVAAPQIEVEVRFFEIRDTVPDATSRAWQLDEPWSPSETIDLDLPDIAAAVSTIQSGMVALLSAPRVRTTSGTNATIKVVSEYRYPTAFEFRSVAVTNGTDVVFHAAVVPIDFMTRDVGITLNVTPVFDASRNKIDLDLMAEVVSEPYWKDYTLSYAGMDGSPQSVQIEQPFFHTRHISQHLSLDNNTTVVMGGMITTGTRHVDDRVPILGSMPGLGRLFRSRREVHEKRHYFITITTRTVDE